MNDIVINGILYLVFSADELQQMFGITIDSEVGLVYVGPESGTFTDEIVEVPENITEGAVSVPVVSFAGGLMVEMTGDIEAAASVSEVILPQSILCLMGGFLGFTNLQKVTCYAESAPLLSSQIGADAGMDFYATPETKELYIPSGSDYSTWETETTWASVNEIYDGFVEIVNGLKYKETGETTVALIGYDDTFNSTSITIPSSITHEGNTYTVTEIRKNSFKNYTGLTEVNIPNSVTKISGSAFSNTSIESQTISVNNISLKLLSLDTKLDKFVLKNTSGITFTYGDITETTTEYACECLGLTDATIPTPTLDLTNLMYDNHQLSIYTIKEDAFSNNDSIITAILPDCVVSIGYQAFGYCSSLTSINIPNSVTSIGNDAFYNCNSLTSVTIPNRVTSIGSYAFYGCSGLTSVTIPNSVTSIGYQAFGYCSSLTSINIPNSVTSIGNDAFYNCNSLRTLNFNSINCSDFNSNFHPFTNCPITTINIGENVQRIPMYFAYNLNKLTSITIPDGVTSIGDWAFGYCSSLTSINIPNSVTSIGSYVFYQCSSLTSVTIPNRVTSIGSYAFYGCKGLKSVTIPDSVTSIASYAFYNCTGLTSVTIPNSVTSIGNNAFQNCSSLISVTIGNSVTSIGYDVFRGCSSLTSITIPNSVTSIGSAAFYNCSSLTSIDIPNSVTTIESSAFANCVGLVDVYLPSNNANIDSFAFGNTGGINVDGIYYGGKETVNIGNYTFKNVGFVTFYLNGNETTIIPSEVSIIGYDKSLSGDVVILSILSYQGANCRVTSIGTSAFLNCSSLTSVTIPDSVTSIGWYAFNACKSLTSVTIPNSVTSIASYVFYQCSSLTSVTIPDSVTSIGDWVFGDCSSLTSVTIPDSVTSIGNHAFQNCSSLISVTIGNSVTSIGDWVFGDCSSLTSVTIGNSVTSIENGAFQNCRGLTSFIMLSSKAPTISDANIFVNTPKTKVLFTPIGATGYSTSWGKTTWSTVNYTMVPTEEIVYKLNDTSTIETFSTNNKVETLIIPSEVTYKSKTYLVNKLSRNSLANDNKIKTLIIESGINTIEASALSGCKNLEKITIPDSVTSIGDSAFSGCTSLTNVIMLNTTAPTSNITNMFNGTPSTKVLFVSIDATGYSTSWGYTTWSTVNYNMVPTDEIIYKFNDEHLLETFSSNSKTESLTIPHNVTYKGNGYNVNKLSRNSLANDNKIKTLTIESGINKIEASALSGCNNLETVNIPNSVSEIDNHAFWMCKNLKDIALPSTLTKLKPEMFVDCISLETITIPNGITTIPFRMFEGCKNLKTVNLPDNITEIQWSAFKDCVSLTEINIPETGCTIDSSAFEGTTITV